MMLSLRCPPTVASRSLELTPISRRSDGFVECALKGPRPRYPRVWKSRKRIGTISKSQKLLQCIKGLSNVKEEVYGALDSFIAWELEFPLVVVKKALKTLENEKEWKRIIQVTKWMLSKGQGKTMGTNYTLLNALAEDGRLEEAEELWMKLFSEYLENLPREFYSKMISIYYSRRMHDKLFEVFADMEELGVRPNSFIVEMLGNVFQELGMMDKYEKLKKKYPPAKWEYRYFKGKRVRVRSKQPNGTLVEGNGTNLSNQASEADEQAYSSLNQNEVGEEAYDNSLSTLSELDDGDYKMNSLNQLGEIDEGDYQKNSLNQPTDVDEEDYRTNSLNQLNEVDEEANVHSIN